MCSSNFSQQQQKLEIVQDFACEAETCEMFKDFSLFMFSIFNVFHLLVFLFSFLLFFLSCFSRPSRRQNQKKSKSACCKYDDFPLCKFDFWAVVRNGGLVEGDLPLSFFIFSYVPSPSFFAHFFKIISLPALFSQRCFLRGRCSMEMWCPDDIGVKWMLLAC